MPARRPPGAGRGQPHIPVTMSIAALSLIVGADFRPQDAATIRSANLRTAAIPLHTCPDSPERSIATEPPAVSACPQFL